MIVFLQLILKSVLLDCSIFCLPFVLSEILEMPFDIHNLFRTKILSSIRMMEGLLLMILEGMNLMLVVVVVRRRYNCPFTFIYFQVLIYKLEKYELTFMYGGFRNLQRRSQKRRLLFQSHLQAGKRQMMMDRRRKNRKRRRIQMLRRGRLVLSCTSRRVKGR